VSLAHSYTLFAPGYDFLVGRALDKARRENLDALRGTHGQHVLLPGIGTGLDIPHLPQGNHYVGLDLTPAMLKHARHQPHSISLSVDFLVGDAMSLPFAEASFDWVILHLILAVVPHPERALSEASRVLKRAGKILIFDKFLKPRQKAPIRRMLSPLLGRIATRTNVVFETLLDSCPDLVRVEDVPALGNGWFRKLLLEKR
jgi:ubiquinone/menaquinone biosynthesis C-methylase UbiE